MLTRRECNETQPNKGKDGLLKRKQEDIGSNTVHQHTYNSPADEMFETDGDALWLEDAILGGPDCISQQVVDVGCC
eukprot:765789-Hanusia_phi.AAC.2